jgi:hypothetical protein
MTESPFAQPGRHLSEMQLDALAHARAAETDDGRYAAINLIVPDHQREEFEELVKLAVHDDQARDRREKSGIKRELRLKDESRLEYVQERTERLTSDEGMAEQAEAFSVDVMDRDGIMLIPDAEPLINDFLCKEQLCRIFGPPKSLKSFIALDMAMCVSTGLRWAGYGTQKARVLYVVAEGARGTKKRIAAWEKHTETISAVAWYPKAVQVGDADQMRQLISYCTLGGFEFIIFDTQARCTVGVKENDNTEMGVIISALDALKERTKACVLLVHHSGTEGGRGRGATAWDGAVDAEFEVRREPGTTQVTFVSRFQKDIPEAPEIKFEGLPLLDSLAFQMQGTTPPAAVEIIVTGKQSQVLHAVAEFGEVGVSTTGVATALGLTKEERGRIGTHVNSLIKKELLRKVPGTARYEITYTGLRQVEAVAATVRQGPEYVQPPMES